MLDGERIAEVEVWSDDDDESDKREVDQSSITTTVVCDTNENVRAEVDNVEGGEIFGSVRWPFTIFTGVLIQPM